MEVVLEMIWSNFRVSARGQRVGEQCSRDSRVMFVYLVASAILPGSNLSVTCRSSMLGGAGWHLAITAAACGRVVFPCDACDDQVEMAGVYSTYRARRGAQGGVHVPGSEALALWPPLEIGRQSAAGKAKL